MALPSSQPVTSLVWRVSKGAVEAGKGGTGWGQGQGQAVSGGEGGFPHQPGV